MKSYGSHSELKIWIVAAVLFWMTSPEIVWAQKKFLKAVPVGVAQAVELSSETKIKLPGTVMAWSTTRLAAEVEGRVEELLFNEGDTIKKGAPLVRIRTRPMQLQRNMALSKKRLVETRLEELLAGTRLETISAAQSSVEQAEARVQLAENELNRIQQLYQDGVLSLDDFDKADAEADEARAGLNEKESILKEYQAGPRIEKIKQERANLQAAEEQIKIIEDDINRATIHAPYNGYIVKKETEVGEWLEKGDPAVVLIASGPIKVEVHIPQSHFNSVKLRSSALIILETYGNPPTQKTFKGKVIEKIRLGDTLSRTFPVRIKVSRPGAELVPGMLVRVELATSKSKNKTLYVPKDALVRTPKEISVWVVRPDKDKNMKAHKIIVRPGSLVDSMVAIFFNKKKIQPGEWVVVQGNERLKPKALVNIIHKIE